MSLPTRTWEDITRLQGLSGSKIIGVFDSNDPNTFFEIASPNNSNFALGVNFATLSPQAIISILGAGGTTVTISGGVATVTSTSLTPIADNAVWGIGDSITANGYTAPSGANGPIFTELNYLLWASLASNAQLRFGGIAATGGYTSAQVLATHVPTVIAQNPKPRYCVVLCGTNDVPLGGTATIINLKAIYAALVAAGITPVACTLTPRNDMDIGSTGLLTNLNNWIARYARLNGWPCVDFWAATVNPATSQWTAGYNADNVHPNGLGARVMGVALWASLADLISPVTGFIPSTNYWASLHNQTNCLFLTDTNSDGLADGYSVASGTGTPTLTAMSANEGLGNWQNLARTTDYFIRASNAITLVPGNRMLLVFKIKTSGVAAGAQFQVKLATTNLDNDICSFNAVTADNVADVPTAMTFAMEFVVPSGMSTNSCETFWSIRTAAGTLSIGQYSLIDLTANGLV